MDQFVWNFKWYSQWNLNFSWDTNLFQFEDMSDKELLQILIGIVDTQLFKTEINNEPRLLNIQMLKFLLFYYY